RYRLRDYLDGERHPEDAGTAIPPAPGRPNTHWREAQQEQAQEYTERSPCSPEQDGTTHGAGADQPPSAHRHEGPHQIENRGCSGVQPPEGHVAQEVLDADERQDDGEGEELRPAKD